MAENEANSVKKSRYTGGSGSLDGRDDQESELGKQQGFRSKGQDRDTNRPRWIVRKQRGPSGNLERV